MDGKELTKADGSNVKINSDGIALSPDKAWLYYKLLTDNRFYRISTTLLRNFSLPLQKLDNNVEDLGQFSTTDGMKFERNGNLYLGDLEESSIVKVTPDPKMQTIAIDTAALSWPDSYSVSTDGYLYISASQIAYMSWFNNNQNRTIYSYKIFRLNL
jgi:sugar lactone lactonase YvrE